MVPEAKGGPNTDENCIPLCFDCHTEVGHYSADHPKGTKFSATELKAHRDRWFSQIATGVSTTAPSDHIALDRKLFEQSILKLGGSNRMLHFKNHDYSNPYPSLFDDLLYHLLYASELPGSIFFDTQMESAFSDLKAAISAYIKSQNNRVWCEGNGRSNIPQEWLEENRAGVIQTSRFDEAVEVMNKTATAVWEAYVQYVRTGRARLLAEEPPITTVDEYLHSQPFFQDYLKPRSSP